MDCHRSDGDRARSGVLVGVDRIAAHDPSGRVDVDLAPALAQVRDELGIDLQERGTGKATAPRIEVGRVESGERRDATRSEQLVPVDLIRQRPPRERVRRTDCIHARQLRNLHRDIHRCQAHDLHDDRNAERPKVLDHVLDLHQERVIVPVHAHVRAADVHLDDDATAALHDQASQQDHHRPRLLDAFLRQLLDGHHRNHPDALALLQDSLIDVPLERLARQPHRIERHPMQQRTDEAARVRHDAARKALLRRPAVFLKRHVALVPVQGERLRDERRPREVRSRQLVMRIPLTKVVARASRIPHGTDLNITQIDGFSHHVPSLRRRLRRCKATICRPDSQRSYGLS